MEAVNKTTNMKSRITIDVDYNNQPVVKIEYNSSEDVRDTLVKRFLEALSIEEPTVKVSYRTPPTADKLALLSPVGKKEVEKE